MGLSFWFHLFLIFILQLQFAYYYYYPTHAFSYSPPHNHFECPYEHSLALLQFKQNFNIDSYASEVCEDYGQSPRPKTRSWNRTIDCCKWEGVTCDGLTGHVIGLDLSCSQLQGTIHSNSSLFKLSHLKSLNLALNDFSLSRISHQFGQFASLMHLNLSNSNFAGDVPSKIPHLSNLVSLDLSHLSHVKLETNNFQMLLQNLTQLRQLSLSKVNISSAVFPLNLSSSLMLLDLSETGLRGNLPDEVLHLPNLQKLRYFKAMMEVQGYSTKPEYMYITEKDDLLIFYNYSVEVVMKGMERELEKIQTTFTIIDMSNNKFEGEIPNYIGNLRSLRELNLSHNKLEGGIPPLLGKLSVLESLDLSSNQLKGEIPQQLTGLISLAFLNLSQNHLVGCIPQGKQFNTFEKESYSRNSALRGFPLSKDCGGEEMPHQHSPTNLQQDDDSDFESGFTWKAVCLGYSCGIIFGLVMGYLMFLTGKPKWLIRLVGEYQYKNRMKRCRQRRAISRN